MWALNPHDEILGVLDVYYSGSICIFYTSLLVYVNPLSTPCLSRCAAKCASANGQKLSRAIETPLSSLQEDTDPFESDCGFTNLCTDYGKLLVLSPQLAFS